MTREEWLQAMTARLRPAFEAAGYPLPAQVRVSCGWPTHRALATAKSKSRVIGQCFSPSCSADGTHELFISPAVSDTAQVAATLVHELIHAAIGNKAGHGPKFRAVAVALGLAGKMTATHASPELTQRLNALAADSGQYGSELGPYPHTTLDLSQQPKQSTRMLKIECPTCGYTVRAARRWITVGLPTCPCGEEMQAEA